MHNPIVIAALGLLADAAWLGVGMSLVGWTFAQHAALLPFWMVLSLLAAAYGVGHFAPAYDPHLGPQAGPPTGRWLVIQGGCGGVMILIAVQLGAPAVGLDGLWPIAVLSGEATGTQVVGIVLSLVAALLLWRRGVNHAIGGLGGRFASIFFAGSTVVVLTALINSICDCGLLDQKLAALFFVVTLSGLALSQLPADDGNGRFWCKMALMVMAGVLVTGFGLSEFSRTYGASLASTAGELWLDAVTIVVDAVIVVLGPVIIWLIAFLQWAISFAGGEGGEFRLPSLDALHTLRRTQSTTGLLAYVIQVPLALLLLYVLYKTLLKRFRNRSLRPEPMSMDGRESLDAQGNTGLTGLLMELLPAWLRGNGTGWGGWQYPRGQSGITEAFELYFEMLDRAMQKGWRFDPCVTPTERISELGRCLGQAPVAEITECFNLACYGARPTDVARLHELKSQLTADA
jgi:hypothetical protein